MPIKFISWFVKAFLPFVVNYDREDWHRRVPIMPVLTEDGWLWWLWPIWRRRAWSYGGWEGDNPYNRWSLKKPGKED